MAGGSQWNGLTEYKYDKKSSNDKYSLKIASLLNDSSISKQIPEMQTFYRANYPSTSGLDFSKGATKVELKFVEYTPIDTGATALTVNDTFSKYRGFGFTDDQYTWIMNADSGLFHLDDTAAAIVVTPNYTCTDASNNNRCSVPAGYYEAKLKLTSKGCIDHDFCAYEITILETSLYFYMCDDCADWTLVPKVKEPVIETKPLPAVVEEVVVPVDTFDAELRFAYASMEFDD